MSDKEHNFWDGRTKRWRKENAMGKVKDSEREGILECEIAYYADYDSGQIGTVCHELLQRREEARKTCKWELDDDGFWETDCGHGFTLNDGTLGENRMAFCPYCGHPIEEVQS